MNDFTNNLYRSLWPLEFWPSICRWQTFTNGANLQLCSEPFKCGWTNYKPWWYMHQTIHLKPDMMGNNACLCTETGQGCFPIWKKKPLSTESLTIHTNNTHRHWNAELLFRREQRFGWEKKKISQYKFLQHSRAEIRCAKNVISLPLCYRPMQHDHSEITTSS